MSEPPIVATTPASPSTRIRTTPAARLLERWIERLRTDSLVRNSLFIMATTVVNSALGFGFWVAAARWYTANAVGIAAGLVAAMTLVAIIATMGLNSGLTQALPTLADGKPWSTFFTGSMLAGGIAGATGGLAVGLLLPVLSPPLAIGGLTGVAVFVIGSTTMTAVTLLDYTFVAERAAHHMLTRNAAFGVAKLVALVFCALLVSRSPLGLFDVWVITIVASLGFSFAVGIPRLKRHYRPALKGSGAELRRLTKSLAGHHVATLGSILPMYILPLEVVARRPTPENAYFYVTWMLSGLFMMVSPAVASSLFAEGSHTPNDVRATAIRSLRTIAALLVPAAIIFIVLGRPLLSAFGRDYVRNGLPLLMIMVASAAPDAVTNVAVSVLRVERRLVEAVALNVFMGLVAIGLTWVLLPSIGILGAGVAWLVSQLAGALMVAGSLMFRRVTRGGDGTRDGPSNPTERPSPT